MKKLITAILTCFMALLIAVCGTTCASSPAEAAVVPEAPAGRGKIVVYSALGEEDMVALQEKFKTDTGIDLEYMIFSAGEGSARVLAEASAPQADFFVGGSMEVYVPLKEAGTLYSYTSLTQKTFPRRTQTLPSLART